MRNPDHFAGIPLDKTLHQLALDVWRTARIARLGDLTPDQRQGVRLLAVGIARQAFARALRAGIDIRPAFTPRAPGTSLWCPNKMREPVEALRACYATVEALQCD